MINDKPVIYSGNKRNYDRYIHLKFDWEDYHRYQDAPEQVAFLRNWHRHKFYCEVDLEVKHDNRELEFFTVLNYIKTMILPLINGSELVSSCEQKAEFIAEGILNTYGEDRYLQVRVYEDNENGGSVEWWQPSVRDNE